MSILDLIEKRKKSANQKKARKALKNTAIGAALGLTVGAVTSALLAPKSGKETREDLTRAARELPEKAKEVLAIAKEKVEEAKEKLKETKTHFVEDLEKKE